MQTFQTFCLRSRIQIVAKTQLSHSTIALVWSNFLLFVRTVVVLKIIDDELARDLKQRRGQYASSVAVVARNHKPRVPVTSCQRKHVVYGISA